MTSTEEKVFKIISQKRNARIPYIARTAGMNSDYAHLICQSLHRSGYVSLSRGWVGIPAQDTSTAPLETEEQSDREIEENVTTEAPSPDRGPQGSSIIELEGLREDILHALENAGYHTINDVAEAPLPRVMQCGMNVKQAADLINRARLKLGIIKEA